MSKTQKTFEIYAAASPSGKIYVGMTSVSARRRWQAHVRRSQSCRNAHPLARAIAKYGAKSFTLHVICTASSEDEAKALEIAHIAELRSAEKRYGYNISRGGDYDAASGAAAMAERLKASDFKASYLA
jgi:group I intron endonuclease